MAPMRQHDHYYAQEEALLFSSLCLLEAPTAEGGKQLDFSKTMFRRPNAKTLEFIIYYVYTVVNGKAAAKRYFKGLWPVLDKDRKQAKDFYQKAQDWLKETGQLDAHGHSLSSFQRNPSGPKLVSFLVDFTDWALRIHHQRLFPQDVLPHADTQDPQLLLALSEPLLTAARAQNQLQAQRLLRSCQHGAQVQQQAEQVAGCLGNVYYDLTAQLASCTGLSSLPPVTSCLADKPSSSSSSSLPVLPPDLLEQQQNLQQLWTELEQQINDCTKLTGLVDGLSGSDIHPHAIDALQLRQFGEVPELPCVSGLDIASMMEAWLTDVAAVCSYINQLAGSGGSWQDQAAAHQQQQQQRFGRLKDGNPGSLHGSRVTPLIASSDASSHAPHLYAQLALHRSCLERMRGVKATLSEHMAAAAERVQQLQPLLDSLIAVEEERCTAAQATAGTLAAGQSTSSSAEQLLQHAAAGHPQPISSALDSSLFAEGYPLVPPTPLLQQLVHKHKAGQQQQQATGGSLDGAPRASARLQELLHTGSTVLMPPAAAAHTTHAQPSMAAAAAPRGADGTITPCLLDVHSPCAADTAACGDEAASPCASSVSSAALPAAELLMAQDIMDVDLVTDDDGDDEHEATSSDARYADSTAEDENVELRQDKVEEKSSPLQQRQHQQQQVRRFHNMRISLELMHSPVADEQLLAAEESLGDVMGLGQHAGQQEEVASAAGGDDVPGSSGALSFRLLASSGQAGSSQQLSNHSTPRWIGDSHAAAAAAPTQAPTPAAGAPTTATILTSATAAPTYCTGGAESPELLSVDPLGPLSQPGTDCLSSARPRRLTFAAAVSAEDTGTPASLADSGLSSSQQQPNTSMHDAAASAAAGSNMQSLRERFASLQMR